MTTNDQPTKHVRSWLVGASADCLNCDWRYDDDSDKAWARAAAHSRKTGHRTGVAKEYGIEVRDD